MAPASQGEAGGGRVNVDRHVANLWHCPMCRTVYFNPDLPHGFTCPVCKVGMVTKKEVADMIDKREDGRIRGFNEGLERAAQVAESGVAKDGCGDVAEKRIADAIRSLMPQGGG